MIHPVVADYLRLGLRLGRLVDGLVDCWIGDPELSGQVAAEPPPVPAELVRQAERLRRAVPDSGLDPGRRAFLDAQLTALSCAGRKLAGARVPFLAEIESYFQVRIAPTDPDHYAAAHDELAALLPGSGPLRERVVAFQHRDRVPPDRLQHAVQAISEALRDRLRPEFPLPAGEQVTYQVTGDRPWNAFNRYLGGFQSEVTLNLDAGHRFTALPFVVTHESYPGHHADHCVKEAGLVLGRGQAEHAISLVNTPQCLVAEGMGEQALAVALGPGWGSWTAAVLAELGLHFDGDVAERIEVAAHRLLAARQDAAIALHDRGAGQDEVLRYLTRWMLISEERARQLLRFLVDPLWRAYTTTYIEGSRLVGRWLAGRPAGTTLAQRYRRLLAEPLLPAAMQSELDACARPRRTP